MRHIALLGCLCFAVACAPADQADQEAAPEAEAPAATSLDDFAGTWTVRALTEMGDEVIIEYEMVATADMEGWMVTFPDRDPVAAHVVEAVGDSVVLHIGPYESALREGVMVSTMSVAKIVDGQLTGHFTATYEAEGPDNVLSGIHEGERVPAAVEGDTP